MVSKLAMIRGSGVGDPFPFGAIIRAGGRLLGKAGPVLKKLGKKIPGLIKKLPKGVGTVGGAVAGGAAAEAILGGGGGGRGGGFRRARGITARELRGFRKVTNLLRKVGMVPKGLRGAKRGICK